MKRILVLALASGFGSGFVPVASGTAGTLVAAALYWFVLPHQAAFFALIVLLTAALSIPISAEAEKLFNNKDDSRIVIDEIVGFWVSVSFLPQRPLIIIAAFVLFRFFDVVKPFSIRRLQSLPGGWGVVIDDIVSGVVTNLILEISVLTHLLR